jgi:hypothetical protein
MRKIKFRARAIEEAKDIIAPGDWLYFTINRGPNEIGNVYWDKDWICVRGIACDFETLGLCTGLKDNNGVEIFEGDVVEYEDDLWEVIFISGCFCADCDPKDSRHIGQRFPLHDMYITDIQVIGNIYENPDLIDKGGRVGRYD